jgi:hypothetical protein
MATTVTAPHPEPPEAAIKIFIKKASLLNILNMLHNLPSSLFKIPFIS